VRRALALAAVLLACLPAPALAAAAEISASEATDRADRDPKVVEERREHPGLSSSAAINDGDWQVSYFAAGERVALAVVDPQTGEVTESWTGYQVGWKMARGYSGAFGHRLNAPYVILPLFALFAIGLIDWRRPRRVATLDIAVLLAFGISHWFFNRADIGVSVPLQYPVLLYLLARALWVGVRGRGDGIRPVWPTAWLIVAALFLIGVRVGLNVADAGTIDVGYASVVGADRIEHGEQLYDNFPSDVSSGDTYGPVNYLAYVPFEAIWPWHGTWDDLPASHGAAVVFDLATIALLVLLALRIRPGPAGRRLAAILAFAWAAYPYTALPLETNSNDALVAMLLVATLLVLARPISRGVLTALAGLTKFAPLILAPMLATYRPPPSTSIDPPAGDGGERGVEDSSARRAPPSPVTGPPGRSMILFALAFVTTTALLMLWPAIDPGLGTFWDRTLGYQAGRDSPFSIWGQVPGLEPLRVALIAAAAALSVALAFWPRRKSLVQVAALGAALLIALELTAMHWFYLYIVWFFPLLLVALAVVERPPAPEVAATPRRERASEPARSSPPVHSS
jgi:hypothetical protein